MILAGRRINNNVGPFIAQKCVKMLTQHDVPLRKAKVGILGLTFKENVPDLRNSKIPDIVAELAQYGIDAMVHDPLGDPREAHEEYKIELTPLEQFQQLDAVILAVAHDEYIDEPGGDLRARASDGGVVIDVKSALARDQAAARHPALEPMTRTRYDEVCEDLVNSPRRWLVTGVAGFIGSALLERLLDLGQTVVGVDNFITGHKQNLDDVLAINPDERLQFRFIEGDLRDPDGRAARRARTSTSCSTRPRSARCRARSRIRSPSHQHNVDAFLNVLVAAKDAGVGRVVYASSSSVYGDHPGLPKHEDRIGKPLSPYAATKRADEIYAQVFHDVYGQQMHRPALLQRVRPPPGSRRPVRRRDPALDRGAARRQAVRDLRRRHEQPRLLLRRQHRAGEPARRHGHRRGGHRHRLQLRLQRTHGPHASCSR